jgi:hypothetical protein
MKTRGNAIIVLCAVLGICLLANVCRASITAKEALRSTTTDQSPTASQQRSSQLPSTIASNPQLTFGSYLGGSSHDYGTDVAVDAQGFIYLAGETESPDFPVVNAVQPSRAGGWDGFLIKLDPVTYQPVFSTYIGGSADEDLRGVELDDAGNIYLFGVTESTDYPTVNAYQNQNAGQWDLFVTKLTNDGSQILYSTYLGGSLVEGYATTGSYQSGDMCVTGDGHIYITTGTTSSDFPLVNPYQSSMNGLKDAVIVEFDPSGQLMYSTFFGGAADDAGVGIALTSTSEICVALQTGPGLPLLDAFDSTVVSAEAGVAKFSADGQTLLFSSYIGGSSWEHSGDVTVDSYDNIWVVGITSSDDLPLMNPLQATRAGDLYEDQFIAKITPANTLAFSTYYGGSDGEYIPARAVADADGFVYVAAISRSPDFPLKSPYWPSRTVRYFDVSTLKFDASADTLIFATRMGGNDIDWPSGVAISPLNKLYVTGDTGGPGIPLYHAFESYNASGYFDGFVMEFSTLNIARGDADASGGFSIADAVYVIDYIFGGGPAPASLTAADADCSFTISIADAVWMINYIFGDGPAPGSSCE